MVDLGKVDMTQTQDEQAVRLRLPLLWSLFPLIVVIPDASLYLRYRLHPDRYPYGHFGGWQLTSYVVIALTAGVIANRAIGVTLTSAALRFGKVRRRHIPWADIQAISYDSYLTSRRVIVWTADGHRIPLPAPSTVVFWLGRGRFDRGYHRIGQWWLDHRGPDWRPIPPEFRR